MLGKPILKGTRITVEQVLETLAETDTFDDVLIAHPHLTKDQIRAALTLLLNPYDLTFIHQ